jgi:chemotaxis protein MotA
LRVFAQLPRIIKKLCFNNGDHLRELISEIVRLSEVARKDGLLALESHVKDIRDPTLVLGIQMSVDGTRPEVIEHVIRKQIEGDQSRLHVEKKMFELMGRCGPAFGMIATLLGLILMLGNLDDPDSIGPSMAMALVGTLYGAAMANMVCIPLAEKLGYLAHHEIVAKETILDGVLAIQAGDNPRVVEQKLSTYLLGESARGAAA